MLISFFFQKTIMTIDGQKWLSRRGGGLNTTSFATGTGVNVFIVLKECGCTMPKLPAFLSFQKITSHYLNEHVRELKQRLGKANANKNVT